MIPAEVFVLSVERNGKFAVAGAYETKHDAHLAGEVVLGSRSVQDRYLRTTVTRLTVKKADVKMEIVPISRIKHSAHKAQLIEGFDLQYMTPLLIDGNYLLRDGLRRLQTVVLLDFKELPCLILPTV